MRIIIISNTLWNVINFRGDFLNQLLNNDHEILIIAKKDKYINQIQSNKIKFVDFSFESKYSLFFLNFIKVFSLYFHIKEFKPSLVLSFSMIPNIFVGFVNLMFPNIFFANTFTGLGNAFVSGSISKLISLFILKISQKNINKFIFHNDIDKQIFINNRISDYTNSEVVLGSGIDFNKYKQNKNKFKNFKSFLFIGRLIKPKGINEYLLASEKIIKKYPNTIVGVLGEYKPSHPKTININIYKKLLKSKNIKYHNYIEDHYQYNILLNQYDCIVLPSYREGLSKSLIEACYLGKSIIACRVPGTKEVCIDNYNGYTCEVKNQDSLSEAMEKFILIERKKYEIFSDNSKKLSKKFDYQLVYTTYFNIIKYLQNL